MSRVRVQDRGARQAEVTERERQPLPRPLSSRPVSQRPPPRVCAASICRLTAGQDGLSGPGPRELCPGFQGLTGPTGCDVIGTEAERGSRISRPPFPMDAEL